MALNIYEWTRSAPGPNTSPGFPDEIFTPVAGVTSPLTAFVPWTLIRVEAEIVVSTVFPSDSPGFAQFMAGSNMRLGVKWFPGSADPSMPRNDASEGVLGMRQLVSHPWGDPGGVSGSGVVWHLLSQFENRTKRNAGAESVSAVSAYLWSDGLGGAGDVTLSCQLSALWGRSG